ncbi:MAG: M14 family zinc carboxypeptidase, partial [Vicinamibacterales bacterium]
NYGVDSLRTHLNWYLEWVPPIWHDLHEAQTLLYTFSGQPPQNANLDPILYTELPFFATYEVNKLTSFGMPGVWHFGFVDTWSPGYLGFASSNHNGMLRMYEIFNQGGANTKKARLQGNQTTREWYRPNPAPVGEVDWSIRNSVNYAVSGVLTALELTSKFPQMVVENFYKKTVNSIQAGQSKAPYAFVIPAGQADPTQADRVVNLLRRQAIEVHRATVEVKVGKDAFPSGSYIVKLNQPYGRLAKTLLEKQTYPDQNLRTYDDSAWTMGLASNIEVKTIDDKAILEAPSQLLTADVETKGTLTGTGKVVAIKHNGSLNLITLRYRLKELPIRAARTAFKVNDEQYPA